MYLNEVAKAVQGDIKGSDVLIQGVSSDSRTLNTGEMFVALTGPHFDGHEFVAQAVTRAASAALVSHPVSTELPIVVVEDTTAALGRLGASWRERFDIPLIAVTGSNGKTTVKEMIGAILRQRHAGLVSAGNLNNAIGVPLTLCRLREPHRFAVVEMGMNHAGEIAYLTELTRPTIALITNAAAAHLEGLGDVAAVARAKAEIFDGLPAHGVAIINTDDEFAGLWRARAGTRRIISFGLTAGADVTAAYEFTPTGSVLELWTGAGEVEVVLPLPGRHNVVNALAAAAAALAADADLASIKAGLETIKAVPGRLMALAGRDDTLIYDDTYNANPASVYAALDVLAAATGERFLVLGDMAELGPGEVDWHARVGARARELGIDALYALGPLSEATVESFGAGGRHFDDIAGLIEALQEHARPGSRILVKGSRRMRMERVVAALAVDEPAAGSVH